MRYKLLGRSGLRVPKICRGTMTSGETFNLIDTTGRNQDKRRNL
jgi:aryl-alcohol dehydrogenase-like predicted oxidoreductase